MSSYNAIELRVQKGLKAYLDTLTFTGTPTIYRGVSQSVRALPAIIVQCDRAEHEQVGVHTGNWLAYATVILRENADDTTEDDHITHAGEVRDAFVATGLEADINTAASGICTVAWCLAESVGYRIEERSWVSELNLRLFVKGS